MDIHVYIHQEGEDKLDKILEAIKVLQGKEEKEMAELDDLKANVANLIVNVQGLTTVVPSIVAAIKGLTDQQKVLSDELAAAIAANDPAAIKAASDAIAAQNQLVVDQTNALAAAIVANTPAAAMKK
jgi:predicted phage tail protein